MKDWRSERGWWIVVTWVAFSIGTHIGVMSRKAMVVEISVP